MPEDDIQSMDRYDDKIVVFTLDKDRYNRVRIMN